MRVLVTGGAGYIGSHTAHQLVGAGHDVTVLDSLYSGFQAAVPAQAKFVQGNIADRSLVASVIRDHGIEAIVHFAAFLVVPESVAEPLKYYQNNVAGSLALIETAYAQGVRKLIFSSTAAVYGNPSVPSVTETTVVAPLNPYGMSKWMTEQALRDFSAVSDFRHVILRYFNVAGAQAAGKVGQSTRNATHLIKVACETALGKRAKMSVFGTDYPTADGTGVRDYIHVDDLAHAHILALEYLARGGESELFNCGYGHGFTVRQVIEMVKKVSGVDFAVEEGPRRPGDSAQIVADSSKIRSKLGWKPRYDDLEVICRTALEWEKKLTSPAQR